MLTSFKLHDFLQRATAVTSIPSAQRKKICHAKRSHFIIAHTHAILLNDSFHFSPSHFLGFFARDYSAPESQLCTALRTSMNTKKERNFLRLHSSIRHDLPTKITKRASYALAREWHIILPLLQSLDGDYWLREICDAGVDGDPDCVKRSAVPNIFINFILNNCIRKLQPLALAQITNIYFGFVCIIYRFPRLYFVRSSMHFVVANLYITIYAT